MRLGSLVRGSFGVFLSRIKSLSLCVPGDGAVVRCCGVPRQPVHLLDHWKHLRRDVSFNKSQTNHCFGVNSCSGELKVNLGSFGPTEVLFIFSVGGSVMIACLKRVKVGFDVFYSVFVFSLWSSNHPSIHPAIYFQHLLLSELRITRVF